LNFIVFDEHTCTAEATVCWGGSKLPGSESASADDAAPVKEPEKTTAEAKPAKKKAVKEAAVHSEAGMVPPPVHKTSAQMVPDPKSMLYKKAKKSAEGSEASASSPVETGSLSEGTTTAKHKVKAAQVAPVEKSSDAAGGYPTPEAPSSGDAAQ
jgi:hypothetical protein